MKQKTTVTRCPWVPNKDPLYTDYHDTEWGVPVYDDRKLFEFLILESAQAGLSWITVLRKRENYRKAFAQFDPKKVSQFTKKDVTALLKNPGIIRNRLKIESAINNAKLFLAIQKECGSFSTYMWSFVNNKPITHTLRTMKDYPETIKEAETLAKDLKKRGFKFLGPKIVYAHMQAVGMVNDHTLSCFKRKKKA